MFDGTVVYVVRYGSVSKWPMKVIQVNWGLGLWINSRNLRWMFFLLNFLMKPTENTELGFMDMKVMTTHLAKHVLIVDVCPFSSRLMESAAILTERDANFFQANEFQQAVMEQDSCLMTNWIVEKSILVDGTRFTGLISSAAGVVRQLSLLLPQGGRSAVEDHMWWA